MCDASCYKLCLKTGNKLWITWGMFPLHTKRDIKTGLKTDEMMTIVSIISEWIWFIISGNTQDILWYCIVYISLRRSRHIKSGSCWEVSRRIWKSTVVVNTWQMSVNDFLVVFTEVVNKDYMSREVCYIVVDSEKSICIHLQIIFKKCITLEWRQKCHCFITEHVMLLWRREWNHYSVLNGLSRRSSEFKDRRRWRDWQFLSLSSWQENHFGLENSVTFISLSDYFASVHCLQMMLKAKPWCVSRVWSLVKVLTKTVVLHEWRDFTIKCCIMIRG